MLREFENVMLRAIQRVVRLASPDVKVQYLYVHKVGDWYVCMGKALGEISKVKEVANEIRECLIDYGDDRNVDGYTLPALATVILRNELVSDKTMQLALTKSKFCNKDAMMNGGEFILDKTEIYEV